MRVTQQRAVVAASDECSVKARCQVFLALAGCCTNAKRVRRLVQLMGQEPVHLKPRLSVAGQDSMRYPYLLRERILYAPYEIWSTDITYVPMTKDVLYLVTVFDWHTRYVLSWELSNTLDMGFYLRMLATHPAPYILNSDQSNQLPASSLRRPYWLPAAKSAAIGAAGPPTILSLSAYGVPPTGNGSTSPWPLTTSTSMINCTPTSPTPITSAPTKSSTARRRPRSSPKHLLVSLQPFA